jgi:hypothetical protein
MTISEEWLELKKRSGAKDVAVRYRIKIYEPDDSGVCRVDTMTPDGETVRGIMAFQDGTLKRASPLPLQEPPTVFGAPGQRYSVWKRFESEKNE